MVSTMKHDSGTPKELSLFFLFEFLTGTRTFTTHDSNWSKLPWPHGFHLGGRPQAREKEKKNGSRSPSDQGALLCQLFWLGFWVPRG